MSDFDPDAYLQQSSATAATFDPDAYLTQPPAPAASEKKSYAPPASTPVGRNPKMGRIDTKSDATAGDLTQAVASGVNAGAMDLLGIPMDAAANVVDLGKAGLGTLYHAVTGNSLPAALQIGDRALVPGTAEWMKAKARQTVGANTVDVSNSSGQDLSALHTAGEVAGPAPLASALGTVRGPANIAPRISTAQAAQNVVDQAAVNSPQSMGAAAAAPRMADVTPEIQQAVVQAAQKTGGAVHHDALVNHTEASKHGVQLMEGQATRDPAQFSAEQNSTNPAIVKRINIQNQQMTDALDNIRRETSPGTVHNNAIDNGQIAVDSLKAYDEPVKAYIDSKYEAARAASANGDLQMDGSTFVDSANQALKPQSKFRFLPSTVKGVLDDVANANGKMTLDDYQAYETQLGNEIAKAKASGDGNAVAAIGKVKDALQKVQPLDDETSQAKALFDTARSSAKARFDALDADPAYRAAVDDLSLNGVKRGEPSALADRFLDKYALGTAPKVNVDLMVSKLDEDARGAVASHTLNQIRKAAIPPNGAVSPHGFNSSLQKYDPKLDSLLPPETRESLESLGRVITNAKVPPPGHYVNYSKSGVLINAAQGLGEAAVNAKTLGLGMPIVKGIAERNFAKKALAPGAGLTRLSDVTKQ